MKKLISIILTIIMVLSAFTVIPTASAKAKEYKSKNCIYTLNSKGEATVVGNYYKGDYWKTPSYWKIPSKLDGHKVVKIAIKTDDGMVILHDNIVKIKIPNSVKSITKSLKTFAKLQKRGFHSGDDNDVRIVCSKNSFAHKYAIKNKINYIISGKTYGDLCSLWYNYGYRLNNSKNDSAYILPTMVYTSMSIKPSFKIMKGDFKLKEGRDFVVEDLNNYAVGNASVLVKGRGNFWGEIILTFTIIPAQAQITSLEINGVDSVKCKYKSNDFNSPPKMIQYSTDSSFKTKKCLTTTEYYDQIVTGLEPGKTYYFRVANYIDTQHLSVYYSKRDKDYYVYMSGLKRYYGKWSEVKSITL